MAREQDLRYRALLARLGAGPTRVADIPVDLEDALFQAEQNAHVAYDFRTQTYTVKPEIAAGLRAGRTVFAQPPTAAEIFHDSFLF